MEKVAGRETCIDDRRAVEVAGLRDGTDGFSLDEGRDAEDAGAGEFRNSGEPGLQGGAAVAEVAAETDGSGDEVVGMGDVGVGHLDKDKAAPGLGDRKSVVEGKR